MFHLSPQRLDELLHSQEAASLSSAARERLEWIAEYVHGGESISELCARQNIARSTFHRWLDRFDPNNLSTLEEQTHAPHEARTSNVTADTIAIIRAYREAQPLIGKEVIREKLLSEHSIDCSSSTIGRVIERECLYFAHTPLHWKKRMSFESRVTSHESRKTEKPETRDLRSHDSTTSCSCLWCGFWRSHGRSLRRTFGLASIAINIAFIALYLATAAWEHQATESTRAQVTQLQTSITPTVSSLDGE